MQEKFNDFKKYAQDKSKKIIAKIRDKDEEVNIESYDGDDAYYTGSDEDYEEFLRSVDGGESEEEAVPVENTQKLNLGDTINLQGMLEKFREKAGEFTNAAKKFKKDISGQIEDLKAAAAGKTEDVMAEAVEKAEEIKENAEEIISEAHEKAEPIITRVVESQPVRQVDMDSFRDGMTAVAEGLSAVDKKLDSVNELITGLSEKISTIEAQSMTSDKETSIGIADLKSAAEGLEAGIGDVKSNTAGIQKLTDGVFDLKNNQINSKNTLTELEMSFIKLKKKCIVGIVVLSILSAVAIGLQIVQILS